MFGIIAAILAALAGFGTGAAGLAPLAPPAASITPNLSTGLPIITGTDTTTACYQPNPDVRIYLSWPANFQKVPDGRDKLNPSFFSGVPATFDASPDCQYFVMANKPSRSFILVRKDVRISSCKTDELAGPYGEGVCPGTAGNSPASVRHRGLCTLDGYTDLRKVAQTDQDGKTIEIFWNPFSYNVGCNYKQDENCGPGDRRNINLKDFIYVLKKRDAFDLDPSSSPSCPVLWDAGSTNVDACSHYFDVYLAEDVWQEMQTVQAGVNPAHPFYFLKQVVENCQEQHIFLPAPQTVFTLPPVFLPKPFIGQNTTVAIGGFDKIFPDPASATERTNYLSFIWSRPDVILPEKSNLLKISEKVGPPNVCSSGASSKTCYDPLGTINLKDQAGTSKSYKVYSTQAQPLTFSLVDSTNQGKLYIYTLTDKDYPRIDRRDPSIQLGTMELSAKNEWTWATPWCKPAIYLYPEQTTNLDIKLNLSGKMTISDPPYDPVNGWQVTAHPDGQIIPQSPQSPSSPSFPYLYYEAELTGINIPEEGWIIERLNIKNKISNIMKEIGFSEKEISDFLAYWLPRLTEKPYYFVTLLPENVINEKENLTFSKHPDSLIRARFVFEGLELPYSPNFPYIPQPPQIPTHQRAGFTVTDWGGTIVGQSCTDLSIE